jgi:hypothetical protein
MIPRSLDAVRSIGWPSTSSEKHPSLHLQSGPPCRRPVPSPPTPFVSYRAVQSSDTPWPSYPPFCPSAVDRRSIVAHSILPHPPHNIKEEIPLSCLESPPVKGQTIKPRHEIKGNTKKKAPVYPTTDQNAQKDAQNIHERIATLPSQHPQSCRPVDRGGYRVRCGSSKKQPHPSQDDRQPRDEGQELPRGAAAGEGLAGCADGERVNVCEADVGAVEAVVFGDLLEARVVGLDKGDVDALGSVLVT